MNVTKASPVSTAPVADFPPLVLADRSCAVASRAAQAVVRVVKGNQDLMFDSHNFNKHQASLIAAGWMVFEDIREVNATKPGASA